LHDINSGDAIASAVRYESGLYDEAHANWPNLLTLGERNKCQHWNTWCHGAPGIGLSRIGILKVLDSTMVRKDIVRALVSASDEQLMPVDSLCCGNLGRVDLLLEVADKLADFASLDRARQIGNGVVARAHRTGSYLVGPFRRIFHPPLWQGIAGLGYQLLRLSQQASLPSILSFE
jgi:lantibiotic modifying enzyme